MIKIIFRLNGIILLLIIFCYSLSAQNLRSLKVEVGKKPNITDKMQELKGEPDYTPKKFKIKVIDKKNQVDTVTVSDTVDSGIEDLKSSADKHLGDYQDKNFYFSSDIKKYYEPKISSEQSLKPFSISEYKKYFSFIKELYQKKMYDQTISEIDELLKHRLFADERIKLNFIKMITNIELEKFDEVETNLNTIKNLDTYDRFRYELIYYTGIRHNKTDETEKAKTEFLKLYKLAPDNKYTDNGLYNLAQIFINNKQFDDALEYLDIIIDNYDNSDYADNALYLKANVYGELLENKNFHKAEYNYRQLYKHYPKSEFSKSAQDKASKIRSNYL